MSNSNPTENLLKNINYAREISAASKTLQLVSVVSGSSADCRNWQERLGATKTELFNRDGSSIVLSLQEKTGNKTREGNFLGTLLAYRKIKTMASKGLLHYKDAVVLLGMIFGRGERMSPFTQIEGDRKPAIKVNSGGRSGLLTAIEEALLYFAPVGKYLERNGFRGILDKWGDETEIPSIDLTETAPDRPELEGCDIIKFVSVLKITEELANQKDWVVFDNTDTVKAQLARNKRENLIEELTHLNIKPDTSGNYYGGVSLGPVAVSYDVLDIAEEVFAGEITKPGVYIDFDPYLIMAISMDDDPAAWVKKVNADKDLQELMAMVPDFFKKVQIVKDIFREKHGRGMNIKIFDLGSGVYWGDIGQHKAMREKYLSLLEDSAEGIIARKLEGLEGEKDARGNIIRDSHIDDTIDIRDSVIVNSTLTGTGCIISSVVKNSYLHNPGLEKAFAVLSHRNANKTVLKAESGIYNSIGGDDLVLEEGMRSGTLLTESGPIELKVSEQTDLRDREANYDKPIFGNKISFKEAYDMIYGTGMEELESRRRELIGS